MSARKCSPSSPLTKERVQSKLVQSWSRTIAERFEGSKSAFATKIGCCPDTVSNALAGKNLPELHTVLNSLLACPNALDEAIAVYGFRIIPADAAMSPDMQTLFEMSRALTSFIDALDDGRRDHRETLELAELLRPVVPKLTAIIHEAEGLKAVA